MIYRLRQWWKWRKYKRKDWPLKYTGPSTPFIEHGLPLQAVPGPGGGQGGKRYLSPDDYVRVINKKAVSER